MKKLLLLTLVLFTLTSTAQLKNLEGAWSHEKTTYVTAFFYSKGKISNIEYIGPDKLIWKIVNKGRKFITTAIRNEKNGHKVIAKYELNEDDTLTVTFVGDYKGVLNYTRYNE